MEKDEKFEEVSDNYALESQEGIQKREVDDLQF